MRVCIRLAAVALAAVCLLLPPADGQAMNFKAQFVDSTDNYFDLSNWLDQAYGFMPVVSLITDPAVGWKPAGDFVLGLRLDGRFTNGNIPFYSLPFVKLRGIPAMRYQGEYALVAETEERWNFHPRWALDGFVGVGKAVPNGVSFADAETVWGAGAGFRYLLARNHKIFGGIDIARSPEDWAFYVVTGQWWNSL